MNWILQNQLFILSGFVLIGFALATWALFDLRKKIRIIFGETVLETTFQGGLVKRLLRAETKLEEIEPRVEILEKISRISVQKVGFLRFNPFSDTGGDQSFVLVLLDRENNGVIFSSLYTREGVRVYAKNVEQGKSKHALSEEEKKVLEETVQKEIHRNP